LVVLLVSLIPVVSSLHWGLGSGLGGSLDLLGLGILLITGLQDIQGVGFFIKEQSETICDTYSVGILHFEQ